MIEIHATMLETMGGDASIARYARICTGRFDPEADGDVIETEGDLQTVRLSNPKTLRRLIRDGHTTPFEFAACVLSLRCSKDTITQIQRHRTAAYLQTSHRYTIAREAEHIRPEDVRCNGNTSVSARSDMATIYNMSVAAAHDDYVTLQKMGMVLEQARDVLPGATPTRTLMAINLKNLLHFLRLRQAPDAQHEIRILADQIAAAVSEWVPLTWAAWTEATDAERGRF